MHQLLEKLNSQTVSYLHSARIYFVKNLERTVKANFLISIPHTHGQIQFCGKFETTSLRGTERVQEKGGSGPVVLTR